MEQRRSRCRREKIILAFKQKQPQMFVALLTNSIGLIASFSVEQSGSIIERWNKQHSHCSNFRAAKEYAMGMSHLSFCDAAFVHYSMDISVVICETRGGNALCALRAVGRTRASEPQADHRVHVCVAPKSVQHIDALPIDLDDRSR